MDALQELLAAGGKLEQFFTPAYVAQAKAYAGPLIVRGWVDAGLMLLEFILFLGLGLHVRLRAAAARWAEGISARIPEGTLLHRLKLALQRVWGGPGLGTTVLFVVTFELIFQLVDLPEGLYFDFWRERREGLSTYTVAGFFGDYFKATAVSLIGYVAIGFALYALMRRMPRSWWLVVGAPVAAVMLVAGMADPYRAQLLFKYTPLPAGPARAAISAVLAKGQVPYQDVVVINAGRSTTRGDAFFAGDGPTRLIVIYDTMMTRYTPQELAVAVAHEVGHLHESLRARKVTAALAMVPLLFLFHLVLVALSRRGWLGLRSVDDPAGYPVVLLLFSVLLLLTAPASNTDSRAKEAAADAYALSLTHDPASFIGLLTKLTVQNRSDPVPDALNEAWRHAHPASARRIAMALRFAKEQGIVVPAMAPQGP